MPMWMSSSKLNQRQRRPIPTKNLSPNRYIAKKLLHFISRIQFIFAAGRHEKCDSVALRPRTVKPVDRAVAPRNKAVGTRSNGDDDFSLADHSAQLKNCHPEPALAFCGRGEGPAFGLSLPRS